MDNNDIGLLESINNNTTWAELKSELGKCKIQPDGMLSRKLRDYESYIKGIGYERLASMYNHQPYTTIWQQADEIFLDEIRTKIAKQLQKMSR